MPKKLRIEDVKYQGYHIYGFELLSKEYVNNSTPLMWRDLDTGLEFKRSWNAIKHGQVSPGNPSKKLDIDYIRESGFKNYGFILITDTYENNHAPMKWKDPVTNTVFLRSWANLTHGYTGTWNTNDYEKDKELVETYDGLGYKLVMSRNEYNKSKTRGGARLLHIANPEYNVDRRVTKAQFIKHAHSYINRSGSSSGEVIIDKLLSANDVKFEKEVTIQINDEQHRFDFYLPDYNTFIEYDGQQHFKPVKSWGGQPEFITRVKKDIEKNNYVSSIGKTLIRVPYIFHDYKSVASLINEEGGIYLDVSKV